MASDKILLKIQNMMNIKVELLQLIDNRFFDKTFSVGVIIQNQQLAEELHKLITRKLEKCILIF